MKDLVFGLECHHATNGFMLLNNYQALSNIFIYLGYNTMVAEFTSNHTYMRGKHFLRRSLNRDKLEAETISLGLETISLKEV